MNQELISQLETKYRHLGEKPETYLQGLLHTTPMSYWDYVGLDTLLSLQKPRTGFKDEKIFIMYHQVTELVLKMMLHEIRQIIVEPTPKDAFLIDKLNRLNLYTTMLITSFSIMKDGMNYEDYNIFRNALVPASGFQSVQFRYAEIYCTRLQNLLGRVADENTNQNLTVEESFEHIYWKAAGINRATGKKTLTLRQFEDKYQKTLIDLAHSVKGNTVEDKLLGMTNPSSQLKEKLKEFDRLYNVDWPLVHLKTAEHYLEKKGETKQATGGSDWKKYLHPKYQQRRFFPTLWSKDELENWGNK